MSTTAEAPSIAPSETRIGGGASSPTPGPASVPAAPLLDRDGLKALMKEAVVEVLQEQRTLIGSIFLEAWEDGNLAAAIDAGRETNIVPVEEIYKVLEEMRCMS